MANPRVDLEALAQTEELDRTKTANEVRELLREVSSAQASAKNKLTERLLALGQRATARSQRAQQTILQAREEIAQRQAEAADVRRALKPQRVDGTRAEQPAQGGFALDLTGGGPQGSLTQPAARAGRQAPVPVESAAAPDAVGQVGGRAAAAVPDQVTTSGGFGVRLGPLSVSKPPVRTVQRGVSVGEARRLALAERRLELDEARARRQAQAQSRQRVGAVTIDLIRSGVPIDDAAGLAGAFERGDMQRVQSITSRVAPKLGEKTRLEKDLIRRQLDDTASRIAARDVDTQLKLAQFERGVAGQGWLNRWGINLPPEARQTPNNLANSFRQLLKDEQITDAERGQLNTHQLQYLDGGWFMRWEPGGLFSSGKQLAYPVDELRNAFGVLDGFMEGSPQEAARTLQGAGYRVEQVGQDFRVAVPEDDPNRIIMEYIKQGSLEVEPAYARKLGRPAQESSTMPNPQPQVQATQEEAGPGPSVEERIGGVGEAVGRQVRGFGERGTRQVTEGLPAAKRSVASGIEGLLRGLFGQPEER